MNLNLSPYICRAFRLPMTQLAYSCNTVILIKFKLVNTAKKIILLRACQLSNSLNAICITITVK